MVPYYLYNLNITTVIYPCASAYSVPSARNASSVDKDFDHCVTVFSRPVFHAGPRGCIGLVVNDCPVELSRLSRDGSVVLN